MNCILLVPSTRLNADIFRFLCVATHTKFQEANTKEQLESIRGLASAGGLQQGIEKILSLQQMPQVALITPNHAVSGFQDSLQTLLQELRSSLSAVPRLSLAERPGIVGLYAETADEIIATGELSASVAEKWEAAASARLSVLKVEIEATDYLFYEIGLYLSERQGKSGASALRSLAEGLGRDTLIAQFTKKKENALRAYSENLKSGEQLLLETVQANVEKIVDIAILRGALYQKKLKTDAGELLYVDHAPFSIRGLNIKRADYEQLVSIQEKWNVLINAMARDRDWFYSIIEKYIGQDDFVKRLLQISKKCRACPTSQQTFLGVFRNDFMNDAASQRWLQVEYNTIAASFGCLSDIIQRMQKYILKNVCGLSKDSERVQISENTSLITEAIEKAHKIYNKEKSKVLFVVDDFEGNLFDQRSLESSLLERGVECLRRSFSKIKDTLVVDPTTGILTVEGKEISVVYYRCGYDPHHFRTEEDWTTREKLELSYAIKCPSVDLQLVNFKIFQLILQDDQHLHRFLSESEGNELKRNFARIWGINETNLPELKRLVEANPSAYVLKPQREGGGNNFYDDAIQKQFNTLDMEELKTFILMEKINPMSRVSMMIRNRELNVMDTISELGFYSYMIR
eukprot:TRINITY_DN743_c0_g1_i6.p1 TRINITY_DN743_c0_g1~~TRINITY_DN743_c0_g1_i6.p1  ORF type:complete len:631 (-),score=182.75 TRINITY_DN743_c0_g1_i6:507-2399(-)